MDYLPDKPMTCYQAQLTMALHMKDDSGLTTKRRHAFEVHLRSCPKCAQEYEEAKRVMDLVVEYWPEKPENKAIFERAKQPAKPRMTVEKGLKDLLRRCPDLAEGLKRQKRMRFIRRAGAVAACLILALSAWLTLSIQPKADQKPQIIEEPVPQQVTSVPKPTIKIELVSDTGNMLIPANQEISTSADELKTLVINNKHRMVMNANTILSIEPQVNNNRVGCMVKLASGEIFTHVEHDGNPFIVGTRYGQAVITGTTFDVKITDSSAALVVSEGTVQFESNKATVNVTAGYSSEIAANSAPTSLIACDATELMAWATAYKPELVLTQAESYTDRWELPLPSLRREPIVLEETDYGSWVEQKRDWFKQEFPWIFQLKHVLAKEGIEVDYPELLIRTGDIWQFVYPGASETRIAVLNQESFVKAASHYGFDEKWLLKAMPAAQFLSAGSVKAKGGVLSLQAFEKWRERFETAQYQSPGDIETETPLNFLRASTYLANCRTLAWLCVENGRLICNVEDEPELLSLLQQQVYATYDIQQTTFQLLMALEIRCSTECTDLRQEMIQHINTIANCEREISEYEIGQ